MRLGKIKWLGILLTLMVIIFVSCSPKEEVELDLEEDITQDTALTYEGSLKIITKDNEFEIAYNDIYNMSPVLSEVKSISSSGEEFNNSVEGVTLESVLNLFDLSKMDYTGIRFTAGDSYAITLPKEIFANKEVILAYIFDGEFLEASQMPLRVAIDDVRSMYFVSNTISVELINEENISEASDSLDLSEIIMLETVVESIGKEEFMYYDSHDLAVEIKDIFDIIPVNGTSVDFVARDGFEKKENIDVVTQGFIKVTGEDTPLFTGLDLPIGMNIKYVMTFTVGDTAFVSIASLLENSDRVMVSGHEGVNLSEVIQMLGLVGDDYTLTAGDGYSVDVSAETTKDAVAYIDEDGTIGLSFKEEYPKNINVTNLLSISASESSKEDTQANETTKSNEDMADLDLAENPWTISFEGLSDGSFDLTSSKAEQKLELVGLHTNMSKNDIVYEDDWQGYKVKDVLAFVHVEDYKRLTIIAKDGYEIQLMKDQVDDETILAVTKNNQVLSEEDNRVQLVQNTEFATTWIQGVVTIIVNN